MVRQMIVLLAAFLEEMASGQPWSRSFAESVPLLESLAAEALAEFASGRTLPLQKLL